jgi:hypothetical protein
MVDGELFNSYRTALGANADLAKMACEQLVEGYSGSLTKAELSEVYAALVRKLGQYAAQVALEFYEALREQSGVTEEYTPKAFEPDNAGLLAWDVSNQTAAQLPGAAAQRVMQYADETIYANGSADPAHPAYALVPHAGACGWCLMIGSQGWFTKRKSAAENTRHANCKCTVVADFDTKTPALGGYDPVALQETYARARKSVEADAQSQWNAMGTSERAKYTRSWHGGKTRSGVYDAYLRNRITAEMTRISKS